MSKPGKKKVFLATAGLFLVLFFFGLVSSRAAELNLGVENVEAAIDLPSGDIRVIIARIIRVALGFLGVFALLIVLWGGFQWMVSKGEEEKIGQAKQTLINGSIGLAIILSAWAITTFILNSIVASLVAPAPRGPTGPPLALFCSQCNELGRGLEMHYPPRDATGIPRNTNLIITFKRPIRRDTLIVNWSDNGTPDNLTDDPTALNTDTIKIYRLNLAAPDRGAGTELTSQEVKVVSTPDQKTFVFDPVPLLGSPTEDQIYEVLINAGSLRQENGDRVLGENYRWNFTTSTVLDLTPPIVTSVYPFPSTQNGIRYARNVLARVTFNEAINPISISLPGNILTRVANFAVLGLAAPGQVAGEWRIANRYRTAEFIPAELCGQNACGDPMYCLPANADLTVTVRAASLLDPTKNDSVAISPPDGIVDAAGNSLNDRGREGDQRGGQPDDQVVYSFDISNALDITGPVITSISPNLLEPDVLPETALVVTSDTPLSFSSVNTDTVKLTPNPSHGFWFTTAAEDLNSQGGLVSEAPANDLAAATAVSTRALVDHALFYKAPIGGPSQGYVPQLTIGLRDTFQNCFVPSSGPQCLPTPDLPYCCNGQAQAGPLCAGVSF